jgi:hypothetical protein
LDDDDDIMLGLLKVGLKIIYDFVMTVTMKIAAFSDLTQSRMVLQHGGWAWG